MLLPNQTGLYIKFKEKSTTLTLVIILFIGLGLRIYSLGQDSLWFDEIRVAQAIQEPTLSGVISEVRTHVMAMPMDYLIDHWLSRACRNESCFRLPSALWGTLTLPIAYLFFRRLAGNQAALVGTFFLALSPLHVYYSQELRFYASLVFFYTLSNLLILRALDRPGWVPWIIYTLTTIVGCYFHIYVALTWLTGAIWWFFYGRKGQDAHHVLIKLVVSSLVIGIAVLPGLVFFSPAHTSEQLFSIPKAIVSLLIGLGWAPNFTLQSTLPLLWFVLFASLTISAYIKLFKPANEKLRAVMLTIPAVAGFIILSDYFGDYYPVPRQFLPLIPALSLLASLALISLVDGMVRMVIRARNLTEVDNQHHNLSFLGWTVISLIVLLVSFSALSEQYNQQRSNRRELSQQILTEWQQGDLIFTMPDWEAPLYQFYFQMVTQSIDPAAIQGISASDLSSITDQGKTIYLITDSLVDPMETTAIEAAGFIRQPSQQDQRMVFDYQVLWVRRTES
jgi:hypothetical protein